MFGHYTTDHFVISGAIGTAASFLALLAGFSDSTVLLGTSAAGSVFYTGHELYQYFVLGKRHLGKFDWPGLRYGLYGFLPAFVATVVMVDLFGRLSQ